MRIPLLSLEVPERRVKTLADIPDGTRALCKYQDDETVLVRERRGERAYNIAGGCLDHVSLYTLCDIDGNPIYVEPEVSECRVWRTLLGTIVLRTACGRYVAITHNGVYIAESLGSGDIPNPGKLVLEVARAE